MSSHENKMYLVNINSLSILFKSQSGVLHLPRLRNRTSSLYHSFRILSSARCTEHTISHGRRVALISFVTTRPNRPLVTTQVDYRLAPQINTSLCSALWPYLCATRKTSQEVTHLRIAPLQARLIL